MIYLTHKHKGPGELGAYPKSLAPGGTVTVVTADAEPNSESTVFSHRQSQASCFAPVDYMIHAARSYSPVNPFRDQTWMALYFCKCDPARPCSRVGHMWHPQT